MPPHTASPARYASTLLAARGKGQPARRLPLPPCRYPSRPSRPSAEADVCTDLRFPGLRHHHGVPGPVQEPHPPGQGAHPQRVVPGAAHAPRVRRLRRQHRLQPQAARRRTGADGHGRPGLRRRIASTSRNRASASTRSRKSPELFTPQAFITTDLDNNQITAFHPGAMMRSYENHVRDVAGVTIGIVSPDGREGMLQNAKEFAEARHPLHLRSRPGDAAVQRRRAARSSSSRPTTSPSTTTNPTCCRSAPAGASRRSPAR